MPVQPIENSAILSDWSPRIVDTVTVQGSPIAAAAETVIATLAIPNFGGTAIVAKIYLDAWAALTVGTNGTAVTFKIRQTNLAGTVVANSGALTAGIAGAALTEVDLEGSDATPGVATYVATLQITAASANTTISAVSLRAIIV